MRQPFEGVIGGLRIEGPQYAEYRTCSVLTNLEDKNILEAEVKEILKAEPLLKTIYTFMR